MQHHLSHDPVVLDYDLASLAGDVVVVVEDLILPQLLSEERPDRGLLMGTAAGNLYL